MTGTRTPTASRDRDATPSPSTHTPRPSTPNNNSSSLPVLDTLNLSHYGDSSLQFDDPSTQSTPHQSPRYERSFLYSPPPPPVPEVNPGHFPPEIISLITQHLYYLILPPPERPEGFPSPDPYLHLLPREAVYLPPRFAPSLPEQAREAFRNLALVDKTWGEEATRALWRKLSFGMPRAWESVLRMVEEYKQGRRIKRAEREDVGGSGWSIGTIGGSGIERRQSSGAGELLRERVFDWGEDSKWQAMAGVGTPDGRMLENGELEVSTPTAETTLDSLQISDMPALSADDSPLLQTKSISFSRFRTAGMNRSVRQGSNERFVTAQRLLTLLRGTRLGKGKLEVPEAEIENEDDESVMDDDNHDVDAVPGLRPRQRGKLESVGFTEFMDSAIGKAVLDELLFRGGYLAEYEEPDEPYHMDVSSDNETTAPPPFPSPYNNPTPLPPLEPFHARHLQSSHSRSPVGHRRSSLSSSVAEDSGEDASMESEGDDDTAETEEDEDDALPSRSHQDDWDVELSRGRSASTRPARFPLQRRSSGSAFAPPPSFGTAVEEIEERGRAERSNIAALRGRSRFNRSLQPPSAFSSRSSSVPAPFLTGRPSGNHPRGVSLDTERSSSVPASVSGRRRRGETRIVQVLEGSTEVKAIRALDLCGCVSKTFISALEVAISTYRLGPPSVFAAATSSITPVPEYDSEDEIEVDGCGASSRSNWSHAGDERRTLRRTFFPHLRRLGLASSLLPAPLLTSFVLSFPYLTHLDLAGTLTSPTLLMHLALAGQSGPGGRKMRLKALSLARCRLMSGAALVGLLAGDCPPFTSHAGMEEGEQWGSGEVVSELTDLSLYGDGTYPSPLSHAELRLVITISPAFTSGHLRTLDLSSTALNDVLLLDNFPSQPHLIELGLANCRGITMRGVASFLELKAPSVEVLDLSNSCPAAAMPMLQRSLSRRGTNTRAPALSIMELHTVLLRSTASVDQSSYDAEEAEVMLALRATNLRVVELDDKALEAVQGGAGDWRPIWGKGRRGWYVDIGTSSKLSTSPVSARPRQLVHLPRDHPRRMALQRLYEQHGSVTSEVGWHPRKMEILRGDGMMGKEEGLYSFHAYQV